MEVLPSRSQNREISISRNRPFLVDFSSPLDGPEKSMKNRPKMADFSMKTIGETAKNDRRSPSTYDASPPMKIIELSMVIHQ